MIFIETSSFVRTTEGLLGEEELRQLQTSLMLNPASGNVIPGSGGLRKLRWRGSGRGKRGGIRVIYYWIQQKGKNLLTHRICKKQARGFHHGST